MYCISQSETTTITTIVPCGGYEALHVRDVDEHLASLWVYRERVVQEACPLPVDAVKPIGSISKVVPTGWGGGIDDARYTNTVVSMYYTGTSNATTSSYMLC